ncbi:hypothetical protein [Paenibacillus apiarius]|uniref:Sporulation membrane protein YtrI C-terminal domain-containing protein n=1 Tax=Paenibacillus apiarius TaxID=46240 RepID=A0ABT4E4Z5_9BACL|nr:hypothetical protein [Paenibacillus apiarius]MCY9514905.1 hypothetical protein [Paenibacillus apiarius]MCY9523321.1 hypothetical protein [Paenibacillus apiarius]MCY9554149.1 hypothetical protein [Paenibacillus apiarius]MCY9559441.1 hypothetical protein [Paenibacillus apiarius]MCY9686804.1 hypothetical protein [Paenibacillus apiarius]
MRPNTVPRWLSDTALVLVGIVIGAAVYHAVYLHQFNQLMMMNMDLKDRLVQYQAKTEDLLRYKNHKTIIRSIDLHIYKSSSDADIPQADETEIRRRLLKDLAGLKGRDAFQIDEYSKLVEGLLARKIYPDINAKDYTVQMRTMLLTEGVLHVWVDVKTYLPTNLSFQ